MTRLALTLALAALASCPHAAAAAPAPPPRARAGDEIMPWDWRYHTRVWYWCKHDGKAVCGELTYSPSWNGWVVKSKGPPDFAGRWVWQSQIVGSRSEGWFRLYRTSQSAEKYR